MKMTKENLTVALTKAVSVFKVAGECEVSELRTREKVELFNQFKDFNIYRDGDSDYESATIRLDDVGNDFTDARIIFFAHNDEYSAFSSRIKSMQVEVDEGYIKGDDDVHTLNLLIDMLQVPPTFRNLTPHDVVVYSSDKTTVVQTILSEKGEDGKPLFVRVNQSYEDAGSINGIPLVTSGLGTVDGLPDQEKNVYLIVSLMVAQAAPYRTDLLVPDTNQGAVRSDSGQIIGTTRFIRLR